MKKISFILVLICFLSLHAQTKVKNVSFFSGLESKELIGYGLVVGLDGTGDGSSSQMTVQSIKNMLERFGVNVPMNKIRPNNVAAVMVTGTLPPFAKVGSFFDVNISSIADAKSLEGGTLLLSPLKSTEGKHYAVAQGPVSIGGFNSGTSTSRIRKNYTNVGRIPNGAKVKQEVFSQIIYNGSLLLNIQEPDFTTTQKISDAINDEFNMDISYPDDPSTISISVPDSILTQRKLVNFISRIENLEIIPERKAKVVLNERTGTIVAGGNVTISEVAISHGNLMIEVSPATGETGVPENLSATTEEARVLVVEATTVQELARSLNQIKVTPRDLISIFQSLKVSGALQAELVII
mgnify:FL=1